MRRSFHLGRAAARAILLSARIAGIGFAIAGLGSSGCSDNKPGSAAAPIPPLMKDWGTVTGPFSGGGVLTYSFTLEPAELEKMFATALQEQWVRADLTISGKPIGPVGLRFKGSDGTLKVCFENGMQICPKASMKVKFDYVDPNKRFMGLKSMNFHSMLGDSSQLRERLACEMFRRMGVETSRSAHSFLVVNGEAKGLFSTVENLDGRFTKDRWGAMGDGNLYKEVWPNEVEPENYTIGLETNEKAPDNLRIAMFAQALFAAKTQEERAATLATFTDVDELLRYMAVDQAIANYDGVTAFYCNDQGGECTNHNFFWYQHPTGNRFLMVPWDLNDSFTVRTIFDKVPAWNVLFGPADCTNRIVDQVVAVRPPGCDLLFQGLAGAGKPAYDKALDKLLGMWDVAQLQSLIDKWATEISPGVANDRFGPGVVAWKGSVETLKTVIAALHDKLQAIRESRTVEPFGLAPSGPNSFDDVGDLAFQLGVSSETNPNSGGVVQLATSGALGGGKDLRFGFEFLNENIADPSMAAPFGQVTIAMAGGRAQLSALQRIRMKMSADNVRTIHIEVDSPAYGNTEIVNRYGWDKTVDAVASEVTLEVGELALPADAKAGPALADVLAAVSGLIIVPQARERNDQGLLPKDRSDPGFIRLDDVSFE
jgi:spore coat protein H